MMMQCVECMAVIVKVEVSIPVNAATLVTSYISHIFRKLKTSPKHQGSMTSCMLYPKPLSIEHILVFETSVRECTNVSDLQISGRVQISGRYSVDMPFVKQYYLQVVLFKW
jgi:hypothetical protein